MLGVYITLGSGLGGGRTALGLALLALAGRGGGWRWTAGESADGGGRQWERLARTERVDLLTLARPKTIHPGSDDEVNFCLKNGSEQKTQEGRSLPKRTDCARKKTQDLMLSASRNRLKVL